MNREPSSKEIDEVVAGGSVRAGSLVTGLGRAANSSPEYVPDWWERLPPQQQAAVWALIALTLIVISPYSGKPVIEFLVTAATALFVGFIALNQYYISKKQWFAMEQGLRKTEDMHRHSQLVFKSAQQTERSNRRQTVQMLNAAQRQATASEKSSQFTETSFYLAEKAYLSVRGVRPSYNFSGPVHELVENYDPEFGFEIVNGGRTPAFEVTGVVYTAISDKEHVQVTEWTRSLHPLGFDFVMPGSGVWFFSKGNVMPPAGYNNIWSMLSPPGDPDEIWDFEKRFYYIKIILNYFDIGGPARPQTATYIFNFHREAEPELVLLDTTTFPHRTRVNTSFE